MEELRWRHLPKIIIRAETTRPFREEETNELTVRISNIGFGLARNVRVIIGGGRFEMGDESQVSSKLTPGASKTVSLYLRPRKDEVGERVPLILQWSWCDHEGNTHQDQVITAVPVKRHSESQSGTPVVIQAQNYIEGSYAYVAGDQLQGQAHKGDEVNIRSPKGSCAPQPDSENTPSERKAQSPRLLCPNCHCPIEAEDFFCAACRSPLQPQQK